MYYNVLIFFITTGKIHWKIMWTEVTEYYYDYNLMAKISV